jgi:hypothetical protein
MAIAMKMEMARHVVAVTRTRVTNKYSILGSCNADVQARPDSHKHSHYLSQILASKKRRYVVHTYQ